MSWLSKIFYYGKSFFLRKKLEAQLSEEVRTHVEMATEANIVAGMPPEEARYAALRVFGNVAGIQERTRDEHGWVWLENTSKDVRYAWRMLWKNPGFTAAAVISLALCIGANTAIFSMLYALVIKPLPYRDARRIVEIYNSFPKAGLDKLFSNFGQYFDFKQHTKAFAELGLWRLDDYTLGDKESPLRIPGVVATAEMFDILGVQPLLGRFFTEGNHVPGADKVVVLTQSFWESRFQNDPGVLGRTVRLDGATYEIIGVAPRLLEAFDARARFVRPFSWTPEQEKQSGRTGYSPQLYGRLKPTATIEEALAQVAALEQLDYETAPPAIREFFDRTGHVIKVDSVQAQRVGPVRTSLLLLQGGVLLVLLIGCVNVANLLLARSNARRGELATRVALGAGRGAIARQLLVESALLTSLGVALGLALAWAALGVVNRFSAELLPDALPFAIDGRVLAVTAAIATGMAVFIGLVPVVHVLGGNLLTLLHSQGRGASGGRGLRAMSSVLVIVQVAVALILLAGAGLLVRSFTKVLGVDPGFDPRQVITARIALPVDASGDQSARKFQQRLETALREVPGVTVGLATSTPFLLVPQVHVSMPISAFTVRDPIAPGGLVERDGFSSGASPSYLAVMHIPLREGRWFNDADTEKSRRVVVVDEDFARRYFAGRSAVGQQLVADSRPPQNEADWWEIVGVVGNVRHNGVEEKSGNPFVYRPLTQAPFFGGLSVFVRTARPIPEVVGILRKKVAAIDPSLPIFDGGTMETVISNCYANRRGIMCLLLSFAGIALVLSAVGVYSVLAYDVSQRTREIGIRCAIGASRWQVAGLIVSQGLWKVGIGVALGLAGAFNLSRFMSSLLFGVQPTDPLAFAGVSLMLVLVALLACYLPARRAAKIDPVIALRAE